jgi:hypothetical protein
MGWGEPDYPKRGGRAPTGNPPPSARVHEAPPPPPQRTLGSACRCDACSEAAAAYLAARDGRPRVLPPWEARPLPTGYWARLWAALRGR